MKATKESKWPKLPPAFKRKWVAALRSGKFKQGTEMLMRDGKYCCLGVACVIAGRRIGKRDFLIPESSKSVPPSLTGRSDIACLLSAHNDGEVSRKWSFPRIATWIEKNL